MKQLTRRHFLKAAGAAVIAAACGVYEFIPGTKSLVGQVVKTTKATAAHYNLTSAVDAANIRQIITADSSTSRTIMWQSAYAEKGAAVEYRAAGAEDTLTIPAADTELNDDGTVTYIYSAAITGLTPGGSYEYRVGYTDRRSEWFPLKTAAGSTFKALIFPDSQSADYGVWKNTAMPAWERNKDAQFFINIGDLVDNGQSGYQWNAWFEGCEDMIRQIPLVPLDGNHEMYDLNWQMHLPVSYTALFDRYGVDIVLSGHLHTYRNRGRIKNFQRDETGTLYLLTGVAGDVRYPSLWKRHALDVYVPPQPETDNYMTMEATTDTIRFQCFLPDGTLLDTAELRK